MHLQGADARQAVEVEALHVTAGPNEMASIRRALAISGGGEAWGCIRVDGNRATVLALSRSAQKLQRFADHCAGVAWNAGVSFLVLDAARILRLLRLRLE